MSQETLTAPIRRVNPGAVVGFLIFVEFTSGLVQGYYLPLLPQLQQFLGVSDADISWFLTVQTLSAGVCVPVLSKLGDMYGHRRILRIAIISVLIGCVIVAFSPNLILTLIGRVLVGPLAVWLPLEIAIVHSRIRGETARKAIGNLVSSLTVGVFVGSLAGGMLGRFVESLTVLLIIPVVVLVICTIIVFTLIPESIMKHKSTKIDGLGFVLLALFMVALLVGLRMAQANGFTNPIAITLVVGAFVLLGIFIWWELRVDEPAIDVRVIGSRTMWPLYVTALLFGMVTFGTQSPLATFVGANPAEVGYGFNFGPDAIGLMTGGWSLLLALGAATFAYLARPIGIGNVIRVGIALNVVALLILALLNGNLVLFMTGMVLNGIGSGLLLGAMPAMIAELSPSGDTGIATGVYNSLRTMGGSAAGAIFAVILSSFAIEGANMSSQQGYATVWLVCAGMFIAGFIVMFFQGSGKDEPKQVTSNDESAGAHAASSTDVEN